MKDFRFQRHKNQKFSACGGLFRKVILSLLKKIGAGENFVYKKKSEKVKKVKKNLDLSFPATLGADSCDF